MVEENDIVETVIMKLNTLGAIRTDLVDEKARSESDTRLRNNNK